VTDDCRMKMRNSISVSLENSHNEMVALMRKKKALKPGSGGSQVLMSLLPFWVGQELGP
jgi:hypothetical protein